MLSHLRARLVDERLDRLRIGRAGRDAECSPLAPRKRGGAECAIADADAIVSRGIYVILLRVREGEPTCATSLRSGAANSGLALVSSANLQTSPLVWDLLRTGHDFLSTVALDLVLPGGARACCHRLQWRLGGYRRKCMQYERRLPSGPALPASAAR